MTAFMAPVEKIVNAGQQLLEMRSQIERVDDVMKYPEDQHADGEHSEAGKLLGELELRDVTFGYNRTQPPLIDHFNLHLRAGESVAFVGSSGCGKSTLAKLISGLYKPWSGEILFDGRPIESISSDELTNSIAVVDQNIVLFDDTLSQNIRMWDQSIEDFAILMACSDARAHDPDHGRGHLCIRPHHRGPGDEAHPRDGHHADCGGPPPVDHPRLRPYHRHGCRPCGPARHP